MFKKLLTMMMVVVMVLSLLSACNSGTEETSTDEKSETTESSKDASSDGSKTEEKKEIKTFTMFSEDNHDGLSGFNSPVADAIVDATGVTLDMSFPVGEVDQKIGILLASGDYPDMIMIKDTAKFVDAEAYVDLEPLVKEHAPNLMKLSGDYIGRLRYSVEDPSIYVLPVAPVNAQKWVPNHGFELQHDAVIEAGYPELKTVQDFEAVIASYVANHPTTEDGQPTIGMTVTAADWRWIISIGNTAAFATGLADDGNWSVDPVTKEATYRFIKEDHKEYFRWLNHMYDTGLLDPDSFVQTYEDYEAKIASGRVVGLSDAIWEYQNAENVVMTDGKFGQTYGQYPIQLDGNSQAADFINMGYSSGYGLGITTACEDPVALIKMLDYMASDEGQVLRHWGIEGVNYEVVDGVRVVPEDEKLRSEENPNYGKETGVGVFVYPFPTWGAGVVDPSGNTYSQETPDSIVEGYSDIEIEVLAAYGAEKWADLYPSADEIYTSPWGAAWQIQLPDESGVAPLLQRADDISKQGVIQSIIASPEDFDAVWDDMVAMLYESGVEELNAKFTELVKNRVETWEN